MRPSPGVLASFCSSEVVVIVISGICRLLAGTIAVLWVGASAAVQAATPLELLEQLNGYAHVEIVSRVQKEVRDYEVGLGAMQKVSGAWRFKRSERFSGTLTRYTWQVVDGFTSIEVMDVLLGEVKNQEGVKLLFSCDARDCGQGVQWANRVFQQPVLYGQDGMQRYRVLSLGADPGSLLIVYASARTADRQYLHAEVLVLAP